MAVLALIPNGAEGLPIVDELGCQNTAGAHGQTLIEEHFIDDAEAVSLAQVAMEINVATENIGKLRGDAVRKINGVGGSKQ